MNRTINTNISLTRVGAKNLVNIMTGKTKPSISKKTLRKNLLRGLALRKYGE